MKISFKNESNVLVEVQNYESRTEQKEHSDESKRRFSKRFSHRQEPILVLPLFDNTSVYYCFGRLLGC
jgi:hypothetical protein